MTNHALSSHVFATLDALGPYEPQPHIAVAVSGGADSMALTLLAQHWVTARGGTLTALTVDHRLRPESHAEAAQVHAWLGTRGIAHHILTPEHHAAGNNLQAAARAWRYAALTEWCRQHHVLHLLLAHHAGDHIETHMLAMARGETPDGAAALPLVRLHAGARLLRPLLTVSPESLRHYLRAEQQDWLEDPSNENQKFARVRLRTSLAEGSATPPAWNVLQRAAGARGEAERALAAASYHCVTLYPDATAHINAAAFFALEPTIATALLANLLRCLRGSATRPRAHETLRLYAALQNTPCKTTLHHCLIQRSGPTIAFKREHLGQAAGFNPAIPLAASPFWGLNAADLVHI